MNKLLTALLASAAALTLSTSVLAAEQSKDTQSRDNQTQNQPNATKGKPEQSDAKSDSNRTKDSNAATKQQDRESVGAGDPAKNQASDQANRDGADTSGANPNTQGSDSDPAYAAELKKLLTEHAVGFRKHFG